MSILAKNIISFIGSEYYSENIYIVADDTNRDIVNAQVVLLGMFSYIKNSYIIEIRPKAKDPMLSMHKNLKNIDSVPGWLDEWCKIEYLAEISAKKLYI